ncbi:MAG: threonine/serine dehydratase [Rhodobacteraceae bacterium]|nr:threonine/serine dehydratase [Paracoccaceae bacterium]MCF8515964.1 threonine/serine dehydratase [Paracoccaceae bacterium]MCF8520267.1 threonine/serine dehydratase [Paracoccaceae bacterium]
MNLSMITAAAKRLSGHARVTPLLNAPLLDAAFGKRVFVKAECLQVTGSFKFRGAWSAVSALPAGTGGVLAYSSGNHGQGVALAAARHNMTAVIVMPSDAPAVKIDNIRAYGGEVVLYDRATEDRDAIGAALCAARGLVLIKPFDDAQVIAGQGTMGLEIASQAAAAGITACDVLVCCGGGGLSAGTALALSAHAPGLRVRTVEPAGFDDMARSLAHGERLRNSATTGSICDAILTPMPGEMTFPILKQLAGPGLVVTDDEAMQAMALAFAHLRIVLEPGGAVALAAALFRDTSPTVICSASGGNVDAAVFQSALARYA